MDLHSDFAGSEIKSHLLIEHARNHQTHDLALACRKRLVPLLQFGELTLLLARCPIALQSLMDSIQQVLVAEWLGQELHRAGFHGFHRHRNISMTADENDRNPDTRVNQLVLKFQTVYSGKSYVQHQATWPVRPLSAQELWRGRECFRTQADRLEHALDRRTDQVVVINDEHHGSGRGGHSWASTWADTTRVVKKARMGVALVGSLTRKEKIAGEKKDAERPPEMKEATAHTSELVRYRHTAVATLRRSRKQTKVSNSRAMLPAEH